MTGAAAEKNRPTSGEDPVRPDFERVFEGGPGLHLLLSPDFLIVAASEAYCRATMRRRADLVGRNIFEAFPDNPDDAGASGVANLRASLERVVACGRPDAMAVQKYDIPRPASEGGGFEERHWSPINIPILDEAGEVAWIIHRVEDVTDLARQREVDAGAERLIREQALVIQQLREGNERLARQIEENERLNRERERAIAARDVSETRFRTLADSLPGVVHRNIASADGKGRDIFVSAGVERLLGAPAEEFTEGRASFAQFMHPEDRVKRKEALARALRRGETAEIEVRMRPRGGGERWWRLHSTPTPLDGGEVQWDGFAIDITERKAAEQDLQQAFKMDAIGQLTGGIAHDFNNLLSVILSNAEVLAEDLEDNEALRSLADMTRRAAMRGAELTNSLLAFARRQPLEPRATNVNRLVAGMDALIRRTLGEDIEIEVVQGAGLWQAIVDPAQLEAAILNLAINARDAMPAGGRLTVETGNAHIDDDYADIHAEVTPGQYVLVCVSDTGVGMTPEVAARAFEPFFTTKEPGKGTGLGLAMVYGFVKQSRGHVKIYSEVGHGTAIKIYLPRSASAEDTQTGPAKSTLGAPRGKETILLVEDDALVRESAEGMLRGLGYTVLVADRAAAALPIVERGEPFDLLFTDVVMPGGITGKDLAERVASLRPGMKILFTSGYTENAIVHHGRLDPGVNLIRKPYGRRELAAKVRQVLDGS